MNLVGSRTKAQKRLLKFDVVDEMIRPNEPRGQRGGSKLLNGSLGQIPHAVVEKTKSVLRSHEAEGIRVRYRTREGPVIETVVTSGAGEWFFVETQELLPVGTELVMEMALPGGRSEWMQAQGVIEWVCQAPDAFGFSCGFGVRVTEIRAVSSRSAGVDAKNRKLRTGGRIYVDMYTGKRA